MPQLSEGARRLLEKQQYRVIGNHSAVKVCGWTKNMLTGRGGCYKLKFYGIMSHQCMQMTTSISCANRCVFCWRGYKAPVSTQWEWEVDDPVFILEESLTQHQKLLTGFGGHPRMVKTLYEQSKTVKHVALSLTGEPIMYPRFNEILRAFHDRGISTFVVTNAQYPDEIRRLDIATQLYISVDAPTRDLLAHVDKPLFTDYWERFLASLDALREKQFRTAIRLTAIKGLNMTDAAAYADLIKRGDPDFVEVKAYMFIGASRQRLSLANMPSHEEVRAFALQVLEHLPGYALVSEHTPSRVVLLAKKSYQGKTWIDFDRFFQLVRERDPRSIRAEDYTKGWDERILHEDVAEEGDELSLQEGL